MVNLEKAGGGVRDYDTLSIGGNRLGDVDITVLKFLYCVDVFVLCGYYVIKVDTGITILKALRGLVYNRFSTKLSCV